MCRGLLGALGVIAAAVGAAMLAVWLAGLDPGGALRAFASGAFGDARRLGVVLERTAPLLLTGLGVAIAFRAGLWNIGAEGQLLLGALGAVWAGTRPGLAGWPPLGAAAVCLLCGTLAGGLWGLLPGVLRASRGVPEVIATILLNFVAAETLSWAVQGPLREAARRYPQTDAVAASCQIGRWGVVPSWLGFGLLAAVLLHLALGRSRAGLKLRAAGLNPEAARAAGVAVRLQAAAALALSGALAGLGGAAEVLGPLGRIYDGYQPGYGFSAIAVALLGRLEPLKVIPAALLFGLLAAGAERMEAQAGVPAAVSAMVQAVILLGSLLLWRRSR